MVLQFLCSIEKVLRVYDIGSELKHEQIRAISSFVQGNNTLSNYNSYLHSKSFEVCNNIPHARKHLGISSNAQGITSTQ